MLGGPVMNLLIAAVLMAVTAVGLGVAQYTTTLGSVQACVPAGQTQEAGQTQQCASADPASPGAAAGLQAGDRIVRWGATDATGWTDVATAIAGGGTAPTPVVVDRDGQRVTVEVTPRLTERPVVDATGAPARDSAGNPVTETRPFVGIGPTFELVRQPLERGARAWCGAPSPAPCAWC